MKDTLLWTYVRLLDTLPTDPGDATVAWPTGCSSDAETKALIASYADKSEALEEKVGLLIQLEAFESSRDTADPKTGRSTDEERFRFKISQAAWAARFEKEKGRRLRLEDELIRIEQRK